MTDEAKLLYIDNIYVFIAHNPGIGEGVVGGTVNVPGVGPSFIPFVCADRLRVDQLMPMARELVVLTGRPIRLVRFTTREEIEVLPVKSGESS